MRIVLNTHRDDPGTRACITGLHQRLCKRGIDAELNDWEHYERYDVAVFMAYDNDMVAARQTNPDIRIGLADPKQATPEHMAAARDADFLIVTGVEQRDVFYRHNRNVLAYCMFPPMPPAERVHVEAIAAPSFGQQKGKEKPHPLRDEAVEQAPSRKRSEPSAGTGPIDKFFKLNCL